MDLKLGGKLKIGDLILVSYSHGFTVGLFAGIGRGTVQFYEPLQVVYTYDNDIRNSKKSKFWKNYVSGGNLKYRVVKVDKNIFHNEEDITNYEKAIEILKLENIIK
jgi:hypothetical protein